jgi:tetratricopeptide (TPR) repeat protein
VLLQIHGGGWVVGNKHEQALPLFERAVAQEPGNASFQQNLGTARQFAGDFAGAEQAMRAAVALQPDLYRVWWALAQMSALRAEDGAETRLAALFPADPDADRALSPPAAADGLVFLLIASLGLVMALVYVPIRLFLTITARSRRLRLLQRIRRLREDLGQPLATPGTKESEQVS